MTKGEYCPNLQGPPAVGIKKASFSGLKSGLSAILKNVPSVTISGKHSSPEVNLCPSSSALTSASGHSLASIPIDLKAAANVFAPP